MIGTHTDLDTKDAVFLCRDLCAYQARKLTKNREVSRVWDFQHPELVEKIFWLRCVSPCVVFCKANTLDKYGPNTTEGDVQGFAQILTIYSKTSEVSLSQKF